MDFDDHQTQENRCLPVLLARRRPRRQAVGRVQHQIWRDRPWPWRNCISELSGYTTFNLAPAREELAINKCDMGRLYNQGRAESLWETPGGPGEFAGSPAPEILCWHAQAADG